MRKEHLTLAMRRTKIVLNVTVLLTSNKKNVKHTIFLFNKQLINIHR